jgi:hypothetical protein
MKSTPKPRKFRKRIKHESKMANKEFPKSKLNCKKERNSKHKKTYKEENEHDDHDNKIQMTGFGSLVEVYHKYFGKELVCNESHRSLEKQGNHTMIKEASASLLKECPFLSGVFGKEKCDDNNQTISLISLFSPHTHVKQARW